MATLNTLLVTGNSVNGTRAWASQSYLDIDEGISGADGNVISDNTNANATLVTSFLLGDTNSDFGDMIDLSWQIRYRVSGAQTNVRDLHIRIVKESDGTVLAAANSGGTFSLVEAGITSTTLGNSSVTSFAYVNTGASKSDWDDARVEIQLTVDRNMGGDANGIEVDSLEMTGNYNIFVGPTMSNVKVNVGDVWKDGVDAWVNVGDTWKKVVDIWINVGDTWKKVT